CADSGYVGIDMCTCMKLTVAELRLNDSELGRLCADQNFENFDLKYYKEGAERENMKHNYTMLYEFANGFDSKTEQCWLLLGNTGLGKTHLSTAVGITVIRRGYDVVYKTIQSVIDDFREVQFKGGDSDSMKKYYDCDLLIVDDLGAEMANQFTVMCIYNLINTRMNKRRPTIFSTNLTPAELRERYADRITSRLFGEYASLMFTGTDVRRQKLRAVK
ncbi:MAG: ATP-binding protein, partial [Clostridia bacterium]|nr:ATP-binding protein [Clostridia bacterium]